MQFCLSWLRIQDFQNLGQGPENQIFLLALWSRRPLWCWFPPCAESGVIGYMEKSNQRSTVLINRAALKCVCACACVCVCVCVREREREREIDAEAPADFWPLTTLCWRFYPEAKCKSLQHCRERTWSLKGYEWVCICCWVCVMMWANNNTKKLMCRVPNGHSDGCNYVISCMSSFVI